MVEELMKEVSKLKWIDDPQKELKNLLSFKDSECKKDLFLSSNKTIEFSEIDHYFKVNNEFYT